MLYIYIIYTDSGVKEVSFKESHRLNLKPYDLHGSTGAHEDPWSIGGAMCT